jgi:putative transposase
MRFTFIEQHRTEFSISCMCKMLDVSSSGYYAWRERQPSPREQANERLVEHIRKVHQHSRHTYGSPRIHAELQDQGITVSRKRVARLMRQHKIIALHKRRHKMTTRRDPAHVPAANLLAQDFTAEQMNEKWLADITYIDTAEGWLYLAAVLDTYSRMIVGWALHTRLHTAVVASALQMALGRRHISEPLIHHSDQGSQYTSHAIRDLLHLSGIQVSMSGVGNCYDNAMMESFFATLKTECAFERFTTRDQARQAIFEYIEIWYNRSRRHSALDYLSPAQFELLSV